MDPLEDDELEAITDVLSAIRRNEGDFVEAPVAAPAAS
jgi:hypothetical protein